LPTYTKHILTGSTNGRGVQVVATASTGTTIHTATAVASILDEVWLYAVNHGAAVVDLTVECGGTTSGDRIEVGVPPQQGLMAVIPGFCFSGGVVIAAYASVASGLTLHGFVNRISG
jgi:hypothetical protein